MLTIYTEEHPAKWDTYLPYIMFAYRSSIHSTTGFTPNKLLFGREVRLPMHIVIGDPNQADQDVGSADVYDNYVDEMADKMRGAFAMASKITKREMKVQKHHYDIYIYHLLHTQTKVHIIVQVIVIHCK